MKPRGVERGALPIGKKLHSPNRVNRVNLDPVTASQSFHFISIEKIAPLFTLRAELTPFGRPMLLTQLAVLTEFVLFSYNGNMIYTSIRSVGLTFLFPSSLRYKS